MEKQKLLYQQARLHTRGAAEMVLQMISACKGETPGAAPRMRGGPCAIPPHPSHGCPRATHWHRVAMTVAGFGRGAGRHGVLHPQVGHLHPQRGQR